MLNEFLRMKGQNMPNFAELIFADSMSRGDFAELIFADTKYKRFFMLSYLLFKHKTNNLPVYKQQTNNKVLKFENKKNVQVKRM